MERQRQRETEQFVEEIKGGESEEVDVQRHSPPINQFSLKQK